MVALAVVVVVREHNLSLSKCNCSLNGCVSQGMFIFFKYNPNPIPNPNPNPHIGTQDVLSERRTCSEVKIVCFPTCETLFLSTESALASFCRHYCESDFEK